MGRKSCLAGNTNNNNNKTKDQDDQPEQELEQERRKSLRRVSFAAGASVKLFEPQQSDYSHQHRQPNDEHSADTSMNDTTTTTSTSSSINSKNGGRESSGQSSPVHSPADHDENLNLSQQSKEHRLRHEEQHKKYSEFPDFSSVGLGRVSEQAVFGPLSLSPNSVVSSAVVVPVAQTDAKTQKPPIIVNAQLQEGNSVDSLTSADVDVIDQSFKQMTPKTKSGRQLLKMRPSRGRQSSDNMDMTEMGSDSVVMSGDEVDVGDLEFDLEMDMQMCDTTIGTVQVTPYSGSRHARKNIISGTEDLSLRQCEGEDMAIDMDTTDVLSTRQLGQSIHNVLSPKTPCLQTTNKSERRSSPRFHQAQTPNFANTGGSVNSRVTTGSDGSSGERRSAALKRQHHNKTRLESSPGAKSTITMDETVCGDAHSVHSSPNFKVVSTQSSNCNMESQFVDNQTSTSVSAVNYDQSTMMQLTGVQPTTNVPALGGVYEHQDVLKQPEEPLSQQSSKSGYTSKSLSPIGTMPKTVQQSPMARRISSPTQKKSKKRQHQPKCSTPLKNVAASSSQPSPEQVDNEVKNQRYDASDIGGEASQMDMSLDITEIINTKSMQQQDTVVVMDQSYSAGIEADNQVENTDLLTQTSTNSLPRSSGGKAQSDLNDDFVGDESFHQQYPPSDAGSPAKCQSLNNIMDEDFVHESSVIKNQSDTIEKIALKPKVTMQEMIQQSSVQLDQMIDMELQSCSDELYLDRLIADLEERLNIVKTDGDIEQKAYEDIWAECDLHQVFVDDYLCADDEAVESEAVAKFYDAVRLAFQVAQLESEQTLLESQDDLVAFVVEKRTEDYRCAEVSDGEYQLLKAQTHHIAAQVEQEYAALNIEYERARQQKQLFTPQAEKRSQELARAVAMNRGLIQELTASVKQLMQEEDFQHQQHNQLLIKISECEADLQRLCDATAIHDNQTNGLDDEVQSIAEKLQLAQYLTGWKFDAMANDVLQLVWKDSVRFTLQLSNYNWSVEQVKPLPQYYEMLVAQIKKWHPSTLTGISQFIGLCRQMNYYQHLYETEFNDKRESLLVELSNQNDNIVADVVTRDAKHPLKTFKLCGVDLELC